MKTKGRWVALLACIGLTACAATGTRVTTDSETYRAMARSQQGWCSSVGGCDCTLDGQRATCALVQSCISTGACKSAP